MTTIEAGFLDFLKKQPLGPTPERSGVLPALVLPNLPTGPLNRALNTVRPPLFRSVKVTDWETKDQGKTLVVDFDAYYETPERPDPNAMPLNYERIYEKALQPLAKEISALVEAPAVVSVAYDVERALRENRDPQLEVPYRATFKLPRGTGLPSQPSPLRVARRYAYTRG